MVFGGYASSTICECNKLTSLSVMWPITTWDFDPAQRASSCEKFCALDWRNCMSGGPSRKVSFLDKHPSVLQFNMSRQLCICHNVYTFKITIFYPCIMHL